MNTGTKELKSMSKQLGKLASAIAQITESDSALIVINAGVKSACFIGSGHDLEKEEAAKQLKNDAKRLNLIADEIGKGEAYKDGDLYFMDDDGNMKSAGSVDSDDTKDQDDGDPFKFGI